MTEENGRRFLEWYSMAQGALHDVMAHKTGIKGLAAIGLSKTTGLNVAARWIDDLELSNDDMRAIVGSGAGSALGSSVAAGAVVGIGLTGPIGWGLIAVGGIAGGIGGDFLGENSDEIYDSAKARVLAHFARGDGRAVFPIGQVASARLPGQSGLIDAGSELSALDVIAEQRAWQSAQSGGPAILPPRWNALEGWGAWLFGDGRASPAAPRLGAPVTAPGGSPGYPPSSAQRMRAGH